MILKEVKQYLRIELDWTEEDNFLSSLIQAAGIYVLNATGKYVDISNELHSLLISMLVVHWYENRNAIGVKVDELPYGIKSILQQIEYGD
jgi:uncharacterized phage protein (predicted DNA packaging)